MGGARREQRAGKIQEALLGAVAEFVVPAPHFDDLTLVILAREG
jgi:serine phosphatase RsbU (regulator of sigma subunit)